MRAARYYGPGDIRIEDIPEPEVKPGQIKLKLAWCGICGSDLHAYNAIMQAPGFPSQTEPHYITRETLPTTLGHEFSGTIIELGEGVDPSKYHVGHGACVEPLISCGELGCGPCSQDTRNVCPRAGFLGLAGWGGGLAEYIAVNQELVFPLPAGIPLEVGALVEPLAVAWHAVKQSTFRLGDKCLITGAGPVGLMVLEVLKAKGASWIGVSQTSQRRRQMAIELGASGVFDPRNDDIVASVRDATAGQGVDVVFECAGAQAALDTALATIRPKGNVVILGYWAQAPTMDMNSVMLKEIAVTGALAYNRDHGELMEAFTAGMFRNIDKIITRKIDLEDLVEEGIKYLIAQKETQIKILVRTGF